MALTAAMPGMAVSSWKRSSKLGIGPDACLGPRSRSLCDAPVPAKPAPGSMIARPAARGAVCELCSACSRFCSRVCCGHQCARYAALIVRSWRPFRLGALPGGERHTLAVLGKHHEHRRYRSWTGPRVCCKPIDQLRVQHRHFDAVGAASSASARSSEYMPVASSDTRDVGLAACPAIAISASWPLALVGELPLLDRLIVLDARLQPELAALTSMPQNTHCLRSDG